MSIPGGGFGAGDFGDMGGFDFAKMGETLSRLGRAISANATGATGSGISPDAVREMATLANDQAPSEKEIAAGLEALAVAQLWLDPKTDFTAPLEPAQIWSRSQWIDATLVGWCEIVAPLAESLSGAVSGAISGLTKEALGDAFGDQLGDELGGAQGDESGNQNNNPFSSFGFGPPSNSENAKNNESKINPNAGNSNTENPMAGIFNQMSNAMRAFGGVIFATQLGETIKTTAGSVTGGADIGIPLLVKNRPALIAINCNAWGAELGIPEAELRYYLALREVAGVRLFNNVPWLREYITNAIKSYSDGIKVNVEKIQEGMAGMAGLPVDGIGTSPEALNEAIANGLFTTDETPSQKSAILRLETIAALIEGWIDEVSASAALDHLPALPALRESARRGRATGGPMQKAFAALIGLEISPRASRDAAAFFDYIATNESISQRDELWSSTELLPTIDEITNPSEFRKGRSAPDDLSTL